MSLINEALKKAQRQRTDVPVVPSPAAAVGGPVTPRIAKRRPPMPARTLVLLLVGGGLVLVMGGVLLFVLLKLDAKPPVVAKAPAHTAAHPAAVPATPPAATVVAPPAPVAVVPPPSPVAPTAASVAPSAPAAPVIPTVALPRPAPAPAAPRPVAPVKAVANPAVVALIDKLRVTGVRVSGEDSKVIMNDRIVRLNDYVDRPLGLRLTKITSSSLGFTDDDGYDYTKDL